MQISIILFLTLELLQTGCGNHRFNLDKECYDLNVLCENMMFYNASLEADTTCPKNYDYVAIINNSHCVYCVKELLEGISQNYRGKIKNELLIIYFARGQIFSPITIRNYLYDINPEFQKEKVFFAEYSNGLDEKNIEDINFFFETKTPVLLYRKRNCYKLDDSFLYK